MAREGGDLVRRNFHKVIGRIANIAICINDFYMNRTHGRGDLVRWSIVVKVELDDGIFFALQPTIRLYFIKSSSKQDNLLKPIRIAELKFNGKAGCTCRIFRGRNKFDSWRLSPFN